MGLRHQFHSTAAGPPCSSALTRGETCGAPGRACGMMNGGNTARIGPRASAPLRAARLYETRWGGGPTTWSWSTMRSSVGLSRSSRPILTSGVCSRCFGRACTVNFSSTSLGQMHRWTVLFHADLGSRYAVARALAAVGRCSHSRVMKRSPVCMRRIHKYSRWSRLLPAHSDWRGNNTMRGCISIPRVRRVHCRPLTSISPCVIRTTSL